MNDPIFNQVLTLLIDCRYAKTRNRQKAGKAINLWEKANLGSIYLAPRGLIYYPDLLERYLMGITNRKVTPNETNLLYIDDLASMICRCLETSKFTSEESTNWSECSLKLLLDYYQQQMKPRIGKEPIRLQLLPGKYQINYEFYLRCRDFGIMDEYLNARLSGLAKPYTEETPEGLREKQKNLLDANHPLKVYGYREAYHRLLYSKDSECLLDWWKEHGFDCTAEAACDYFQIDISKDDQRGKNDRIDLTTQRLLLAKFCKQNPDSARGI